MLVVCNGAAKSGSTWLYNIVQNIAEFDWPHSSFLTGSNKKHPTIRESRLEDYLATTVFETQDVISKNHYGKSLHRDLLLSNPHIRVIDMSRDTRDVIVSSYYDECRRNGYAGTFDDYYWQKGRILVAALSSYHEVWSEPHPQILLTSYEALKTEFGAEVKKIAAFLGVSLLEEDVVRISKLTTIDSLRQSYSDDSQYNTKKNPFFRKGEIGDWKNHFDQKMVRDYEKIERNGIGRFDMPYVRSRIRQGLGRLFA